MTFLGKLTFTEPSFTSSNGRVKQAEAVDNQLSPALEKLARMVDERGQALDDDSQRQDFVASANRLRAIGQEVGQWVKQSNADDVYWIESAPRRSGGTRVTLAAAPIDIGTSLRESLFDEVPSVILTSATLSVGGTGSFEFFKSRGWARAVGEFASRQPVRLSISSSARRGLAICPDPAQQKEEYERQCIRMVQRYVGQTNGHAFCGFLLAINPFARLPPV